MEQTHLVRVRESSAMNGAPLTAGRGRKRKGVSRVRNGQLEIGKHQGREGSRMLGITVEGVQRRTGEGEGTLSRRGQRLLKTM